MSSILEWVTITNAVTGELTTLRIIDIREVSSIPGRPAGAVEMVQEPKTSLLVLSDTHYGFREVFAIETHDVIMGRILGTA